MLVSNTIPFMDESSSEVHHENVLRKANVLEKTWLLLVTGHS